MSQVGEFEFDPELIPDAPELPLDTPITLEVLAAVRKETVTEDGRKSIRVAVKAGSPETPGTQPVFPSLWITEQYRGKAHKSFANFLKTLGLPYTTQAQDIVGVRFIGKVRKQAKNPDFLELTEVIGKA